MEVSSEERREWHGEMGGIDLEGLKGGGELTLYSGGWRKP